MPSNNRLAQALYHWARVAVQHDQISRQHYAELRRCGHSHGRALRGVGARLLYVLCTLLKRHTPFDPNHTAPKARGRLRSIPFGRKWPSLQCSMEEDSDCRASSGYHSALSEGLNSRHIAENQPTEHQRRAFLREIDCKMQYP